MRWRFRLLALLMGFGIPLVLLCSIEVVLRLFFPELTQFSEKVRLLASMDNDRRFSVIKEPDPYLIWKLKPFSLLSETEQLNRYGFRGKTPVLPKPDDTYRIMAFGDSRTFGFGVMDEKLTFCGRLNALFSSKPEYNKIEILNMGVIGYSSFQGNRLIQKTAASFNPDLMIVWFGFNDTLFFHQTDSEAAQINQISRMLGNLLNKSHIFQSIRYAHFKKQQIQAGVKQLGQRIVRRVPPNEYRHNLEQICQFSRNQKIKTVFLTSAVRSKIPLILNAKLIEESDASGMKCERLQSQYELDGFWLMDAERFPGTETQLDQLLMKYPELPILYYYKSLFLEERYQLEDAKKHRIKSEELDTERKIIQQYNQITQETAENFNMKCLHLIPIFQENEAFKLFIDDCHPNMNGQALIAQEIYNFIVSEHILN